VYNLKKIDYKAKYKEYENLLKRLQAEFDNFRKREENQRTEWAKFACSDLAAKLLPFVDSMEGAFQSNPDLEGLYKQLLAILKESGITKMETAGKTFDPHMHEVMLADKDPKKADGIITGIIQNGYLIQEKVLRHAKVRVNRKPDIKEDKQGKDKTDSS